MNEGHIYKTDKLITLKCVDDFGLNNKSYDVIIGKTYTANITTDNNYYFIHETQSVIPSELFITIDKESEEQEWCYYSDLPSPMAYMNLSDDDVDDELNKDDSNPL